MHFQLKGFFTLHSAWNCILVLAFLGGINDILLADVWPAGGWKLHDCAWPSHPSSILKCKKHKQLAKDWIISRHAVAFLYLNISTEREMGLLGCNFRNERHFMNKNIMPALPDNFVKTVKVEKRLKRCGINFWERAFVWRHESNQTLIRGVFKAK